MKKVILLVFLLSVVVTQAYAQGDYVQKNNNMFVTLDLVANIVGDSSFGGGGISYGVYSSPSSLFTVEFLAELGDSEKIGSFTYYVDNGYSRRYHKGEINYEYMAYEFLLSWSHIINLSQKTQLRVGPSFGMLVISGKEVYDPTSHGGVEIKDIPDTHSQTETAVTAGINTGFTWNFYKFFFVDFGYRLLVNSAISFDERKINILGETVTIKEKDFDQIENQLSIKLGWRF
ncbi:MAG: hypothetical protein LBL00_02985 [Endomicrobium sp.]|jgi:hypothetical protein|nr:hypothetical protein [Endomicrobium sp.]